MTSIGESLLSVGEGMAQVALLDVPSSHDNFGSVASPLFTLFLW